MNIKTLRYIHDLLIENEKEYDSLRKWSRERAIKARKEEAENFNELAREAGFNDELWEAANTALADFEAQEF